MSDRKNKEEFKPKEKTVIIVIHTKEYNWNCKMVTEGQREIYFLNAVRIGDINGGVMLLGQFLFEFQRFPEDALKLTPGCTNRLYLSDSRGFEYDYPTKEELNEFKRRMNLLKEQDSNPERNKQIDKILDYLN